MWEGLPHQVSDLSVRGRSGGGEVENHRRPLFMQAYAAARFHGGLLAAGAALACCCGTKPPVVAAVTGL